MAAKEAPPTGRRANLTRQIWRLRRWIRNVTHTELRQARRLERSRARRATLVSRLAAVVVAVDVKKLLQARSSEVPARVEAAAAAPTA